ncbi:putative inhibitor of apoptosis isoform X2 [Mytilus edulis]
MSTMDTQKKNCYRMAFEIHKVSKTNTMKKNCISAAFILNSQIYLLHSYPLQYASSKVIDLHSRTHNRRSRTTRIAPQKWHEYIVDMLRSTFLSWPTKEGKWWPVMLQDAGFIYLYHELDLQCTECKIKTSVKDWSNKETPKQAHARINPNCPLVKRAFKEKIEMDGSDINHASNTQSDSSHQPSLDSQIIINGLRPQILVTKPVENLTASTKSEQDIDKSNTQIPLLGPILNRPFDSVQQTTDAMNSQLTIDANFSRLEEPEYKYPQYQSYSSRLGSFDQWRFAHKQTPQCLAEAGYFYTGDNDIVRCFCCDLGLAEWDPKDNVWTEHARHNPKCHFLKNKKGDEYIENIQQDWRKIYNAKHAAFDDKMSRIATFDGDWRRDIEQTPEILADAGFFYTGEEDVVRCHYCDGGLRHWEQGDVPWEEHARWFPFCKFLIKMKGREFIEEIKRKTEERHRAENSSTPGEQSHGLSDHIKDNAVVKELQSMDFKVDDIKYAIDRYIKSKGDNNFFVEDLIDLIFQRPNEETKQSPFAVSNIIITEKPEENDPKKIIEMNRKLKEKMKCIRCRVNDTCMLFVNCGHRLTCEKCAYAMDFCPYCDTKIKKRLKTFLS